MATINIGNIKFTWKGTYNAGTAYAVDDVVSYNGSSYVCIQATTGNLPTVTAYWDIMSSAGTNGTNGTDLTSTLTTQGDILFRDGSGLQRLGYGTSGKVLTTKGSGQNPTWETPSGGKILQIVGALGRDADTSTNSTSLVVMPDSSITITPTSASSRIYCTWQITTHQSATDVGVLNAYRNNSTNLGVVYGTRNSGSGYFDKTTSCSIFDHPNTTSAVSYNLYMKTLNGSQGFYAHRSFVSSSPYAPRMNMIAMEVEASTHWTN